jgi:hypothetical protein
MSLAIFSMLLLSGMLGLWIVRIQPMLGFTTLSGAGCWLMLGLAFWIIVTSLEIWCGENHSHSWISRAHYLSITLMLSPLVSVLGAKRPGIRVWNVFVVIPMLLMLNWPLIAELLGTPPNLSLNLEPPALMGVIVVLLMVLGNYFGTRLTLPAMMYCLAMAIALSTCSESLPVPYRSPLLVRALSGMLVGCSLFLMLSRMKRAAFERRSYEGIWLDFRDWFGILWTRRVMERLNQTAESENWRVRLSLEGFVWEDELTEAQRQETLKKMDRAFRWIFRRFVDEEWIDERLQRSETEVSPDITAGPVQID